MTARGDDPVTIRAGALSGGAFPSILGPEHRRLGPRHRLVSLGREASNGCVRSWGRDAGSFSLAIVSDQPDDRWYLQAVAQTPYASTSQTVEGSGRPLSGHVIVPDGERALETGSGDLASAGPGAPEIRIDVDDEVLRLALHHVAQSAGIGVVRNPAAEAVDVVDVHRSPNGSRPPRLLVARVIPVEALKAVASVVNGTAHGMIDARVPSALPAALSAIRSGGTYLATSLLDVARRLPSLTARQHRLMQAVALGHSRDSQLTRILGTSSTTVKREVQVLYDLFQSGDRRELADRARALGYPSGTATLAQELAILPPPSPAGGAPAPEEASRS